MRQNSTYSSTVCAVMSHSKEVKVLFIVVIKDHDFKEQINSFDVAVYT